MQKLIITPNSQKNKILKHLDGQHLFPFKIMSLKEIEEQLFFKFSKRAIYELMKKENIKYSIATMYLNQLPKLLYGSVSFPKKNKLEGLKNWLEEQDLLEYNPYFINYLKQTVIEIYGYSPLKKEEQILIERLKKITEVTIIDPTIEKSISTVYESETMEAEVLFVLLEILKHHGNGIPFSDIQLIYDETYQTTVERLFDWFHIPLSKSPSIPIYGTVIWHQIRDLLKKNDSFDKVNGELEKLRDTWTDVQKRMARKIMQISSSYASLPLDEITIDCIEEEVKKSTITSFINKKGVRICSLDEMEDSPCYLLGFNQGIYPVIETDIDYFTDNEKKLLNCSTSSENNIIIKKRFEQQIFSNRNLTISYKKKTPFESFYPSSFIQEWGLQVQKVNLSNIYHYSHLYNKLSFAKVQDVERKYNVKAAELASLAATYPDLPYYSYDNQFTCIDQNQLKESWNRKLLLSYSHLDHFYRCGFRYYIAHVLHLEQYEETFAVLLGNLFHEILSVAFLPEFHFEDCWNQFLEKRHLLKKDKFFLEELKGKLKFVIETIKKQELYSDYKNALYEEKIYIHKEREIPVTFMGIIDKLKYYEENNSTYVAVIDYKTGTPNTNLNNTIYGIDMQLPIYLYLTKHLHKLQNVKVTGFYLQRILNKELNYDSSKNYEQAKKEQLKLEGYSTSQEDVLEHFDHTYQDSEMIKSMKLSKNGFYSYAKVLDPGKMERLVELTEKKIDEAIDLILKADFKINPKRINGQIKGCEYCSFKDLCYLQEKDYIDYEEYKNLDFLGGEEHGE